MHDLHQETQEQGLLVCSPINNACTPLTRTVIACVSVYDMSNDKKIVIQVNLKILSSLDDKAYGLIIGLPDIRKFQLLNHLASQFSDCKSVDDNVMRWKVATLKDIPRGNALLDKFANLGESSRKIPNSVQLKRRRSLRINSPNTNTSYQSGLTSRVLTYEDMLSTVREDVEDSSSSFRPSYIYDEDDEVIDQDSWSDAWQKNDERSEDKDVIDTIVDLSLIHI